MLNCEYLWVVFLLSHMFMFLSLFISLFVNFIDIADNSLRDRISDIEHLISMVILMLKAINHLLSNRSVVLDGLLDGLHGNFCISHLVRKLLREPALNTLLLQL